MTNDQKVFDDVGKVVQNTQRLMDTINIGRLDRQLAEATHILAKAVQALRPSSGQSPSPSLEPTDLERDHGKIFRDPPDAAYLTKEQQYALMMGEDYPDKSSSSPSPSSETQSELPKPCTTTDVWNERVQADLSHAEWVMIKQLRQQPEDKQTTAPATSDQAQYPRTLSRRHPQQD